MLMELHKFQIKIVEQSWLDGCSPEDDPCSHGKIKLIICGESITSGDEDYGISESALALLRTLNSDHSAEQPVAQLLIFHGCGTMLMLGCPIGVDWQVNHSEGRVRISNVVRYDGPGASDVVNFSNLFIEISDEEYRQNILVFAKEAKQLFTGVKKVFTDDFEREEYENFWKEYDRLLNGHENAV